MHHIILICSVLAQTNALLQRHLRHRFSGTCVPLSASAEPVLPASAEAVPRFSGGTRPTMPTTQTKHAVDPSIYTPEVIKEGNELLVKYSTSGEC